LRDLKNKPTQCIIIGGGFSIKEGIKKGLWQKINNYFVIGLNYSFYHFPNPTFQSFVDNDFYDKNIERLKELPLIIGNKKKLEKQLSNTLLLPSITTYYRDIKHGVYKASLVGMWALSMAIYLANSGDEIYLLGYDYGELKKPQEKKSLTHYYQGEINHRGINKVNYYNSNGRAERDFGVYRNIKDIKIYNVSQISRIPEDIFPKLSYDEFFNRLNKEVYNQDELRKNILKKLNWVKNV